MKKEAVINMKNLLKIISGLCLLTVIIFTACSPDEPGPIGAPDNRLEQVTGTWSITKVLQVDLNAESRGYPTIARTRDITNILPAMSFEGVTFSFTSSNGEANSFSIDRKNSPLVLPSSGSWAFDDVNYPSAITLTSGNSTDILKIQSFSEIKAGSLVFKLLRTDAGGDPYVRYEYYVTKTAE